MKKYLFFVSLLFIGVDVKAYELTYKKISNVFFLEESNDYYYSDQSRFYYMDSQLVYCIDPKVVPLGHDYEGSFDFNLDEDIVKKLELINYYGYGYQGHEQMEYYLATQELIWETISNIEVSYYTKRNGEGEVINIEDYKDDILNHVNRHEIKPSFNGITINSYDNEIVIKDDNEVLSDYMVTSDNAYILNNELHVSVDDISEVKLKKKKYDEVITQKYIAKGYQTMGIFRPSDVYSNVTINKVIRLEVPKTSKNRSWFWVIPIILVMGYEIKNIWMHYRHN